MLSLASGSLTRLPAGRNRREDGKMCDSSAGRERRRRGPDGTRLRALGLLHHRQLEHRHALAFTEQRHQHMASVRKLDRIVVPIRYMRVDSGEFSDPEIDFTRPYPSVVVFDVFGERQFGPGKHTDRDVGLAFGGQTTRRSPAESGSDQRLSDLGGARRYSVQTIVTHRIAPRWRYNPRPPRRGPLSAWQQSSECTISSEPLARCWQLCGSPQGGLITNA